jgi:hypothetical protein
LVLFASGRKVLPSHPRALRTFMLHKGRTSVHSPSTNHPIHLLKPTSRYTNSFPGSSYSF